MNKTLFKSLVSENDSLRLNYYIISDRLTIGDETHTVYGIEISQTPIGTDCKFKEMTASVEDITPDYEKITNLAEELCEGLFDPSMLTDVAGDMAEEWSCYGK